MAELLSFLGVAVLVIVTPGQDTALTVRNTLAGGRRAGVRTAAGVAAGQAIWAVAASVGVTGLLVASEPAFVVLKLVGAAYLIVLGAQSLLSAVRREQLAPHLARVRGGEWRQGLLSNLANPKMALFFGSLLPQFGSTLATLLGLGLLFCVLTLAWLSAYAAVVAHAGDAMRRGPVKRTLDAVMGTALVAFGIRLAAAEH